MSEAPKQDYEDAPENGPDEPGAEGGSDSSAAESLPGAPSGDDDESAAGDTDQHSDA